ncbi:Crp/Fnr family transcriptional regulator [Verrucomicrobiales bacterium BCK34]|nr:Crp/Fnr family transcriptional regulator [Verrucomicrobiales bacterium BCK34]
MNTAGLTELFSKCEVFSRLPPDDLENLIRKGTLHQLDPGTVLIHEGKTGEGIWGLVSGNLDVSIEGESINQVSAPGEVVGEISAVSHTAATATVKAATEVSALGIPHDKLHEAMKNSPSLAEALIRSMTKYLGRR